MGWAPGKGGDGVRPRGRARTGDGVQSRGSRADWGDGRLGWEGEEGEEAAGPVRIAGWAEAGYATFWAHWAGEGA